MKTLDDYRRELEALVKPFGAFVRVDRGDMLLVTDAPRRYAGDVALPEGWQARTDNGIMRVTPCYDAPEELSGFITRFLKSAPETADRLARQALAVALREKNTEQVQFISQLII